MYFRQKRSYLDLKRNDGSRYGNNLSHRERRYRSSSRRLFKAGWSLSLCHFKISSSSAHPLQITKRLSVKLWCRQKVNAVLIGSSAQEYFFRHIYIKPGCQDWEILYHHSLSLTKTIVIFTDGIFWEIKIYN